MCPICLRFFARTENLTKSVSIEHIVPDALGGRVTTLTCRRCNNTAGTQLDSHLVKRVRVEGRTKPILADVNFRGTKFRGEVHLPESASDSFSIYGIPKQSDPREINRFFSLLDEGIWDGQELKLRLELDYVPVRSAVALLRSAYLLMFRLFGYRYVCDRSAVVIRESISQPTMETDGLKPSLPGIATQEAHAATEGPVEGGAAGQASGLSTRAIARVLGIHRNTVRKYADAKSPPRCAPGSGPAHHSPMVWQPRWTLSLTT